MSSETVEPACPQCLGKLVFAEEPIAGWQYYLVPSINAKYLIPTLEFEEQDIEANDTMEYICGNTKCRFKTKNLQDFLAGKGSTND
ncbi:MAG: hypothetical protein EBZ48_02805 [Proteobacteria bacterium]|nr:hypothetical protein [Pseudomonadota bacterium]